MSRLFTFAVIFVFCSPTLAQPATTSKLQNAIDSRIDDEMKASKYCSENPAEAKCIARSKARSDKKKQKVRDAIDLYKEASKDPEIRKVLEKEEAKSEARKQKKMDEINQQIERQTLLRNIDEFCKTPDSESCKVAKKDYEEYKSKKK